MYTQYFVYLPCTVYPHSLSTQIISELSRLPKIDHNMGLAAYQLGVGLQEFLQVLAHGQRLKTGKLNLRPWQPI